MLRQAKESSKDFFFLTFPLSLSDDARHNKYTPVFKSLSCCLVVGQDLNDNHALTDK